LSETDLLNLPQNQPPSIKSPMNAQMGHPPMGGQPPISGSSLLMAQLEKQPPCNPDPKLISQVAGSLANKVPTDNLHNLLPNQQQHMGNNQVLPFIVLYFTGGIGKNLFFSNDDAYQF
jgi:hypothetical protein